MSGTVLRVGLPRFIGMTSELLESQYQVGDVVQYMKDSVMPLDVLLNEAIIDEEAILGKVIPSEENGAVN